MNWVQRPGWTGLHTTDEAKGAMPNGTRVVKVMAEEGDGHPVGATGRIIGSMPTDVAPPEMVPPGVTYFYFVEWDDLPMTAVGVASNKIGAIT